MGMAIMVIGILVMLSLLCWGGKWWRNTYKETALSSDEVESYWKRYETVKAINGPIVDDISKPAIERLAAQQLIDRAHNNAVNAEFDHCC